MSRALGVACGIALAFLGACKPEGGTKAGGRPSAGEAFAGGEGRVIETMSSGGYTYVLLDMNGEKVWAAGPQTSVNVGDRVAVSGGAPMRDFKSPTLGRTFDLVYFVNRIQAPGAAPAHGGAPPAHPKADSAPQPMTGVTRAEGGKTVEEVFAEKDALAGKEVLVRGKVVKFNAGIMGKNWLHIQDGTGKSGTHDLTVTTQAATAIGEVVLVRGKVAVDKDFGAGYKYAVIVEDATLGK